MIEEGWMEGGGALEGWGSRAHSPELVITCVRSCVLAVNHRCQAIARVYPWVSPCLPLPLPLRVIPFRPMGKNDKSI